jgi:hypothetical protein
MNYMEDSIIMTKCSYCGNDVKSTMIFKTLIWFCDYFQRLFSINKCQGDMQMK